MNSYFIIMFGLLITGFGIHKARLERKSSSYIVTYEASLIAGGWTHGEVAVTSKAFTSATLDGVREHIKSSRSDITNAICVLNVIKLDMD